MAHLTGTTVVADRYGMPVLLREGDPLPEWAVGKVGDHLLTDDGEEVAPPAPDPENPEPTAPPKAGPGSGKAAWVTYAAAVGVAIDPDDGRDEIIAAVEAALED